jgi:hypothetical protein
VSSAILEIPDVRRRVSRLTVAEYHLLGEYNDRGQRTELLRVCGSLLSELFPPRA